MRSRLIDAGNATTLLIGLTLILYSLVHGIKEQTTNTDTHNYSNNHNLKYGNPSQANADNLDNLLIIKKQYTLSYNCTKGIANWASWHLNTSWMGNVGRTEYFKSDTNLPNRCQIIDYKDYSGSNYDRGHLTPSADRSNTIANNRATYLMINLVPQSKASNQEVWRELEEYCRDLASSGNNLYQIAGWGGIDGQIKGKVTIPRYLWKVILIEEDMETIAILIPNNETVKDTDWQDYLVSVDKIESITGYDFFSNLDDSLESKIESRVYW